MTNQAGAIVSSESEELILVDEQDAELGTLSKAECHDGDGVLHRAFSLFLFNDHGELLLQQRSSTKRLWPGFWSNSCCSHPRAGETLDEAIDRRVQQELGLTAEFEFVYKFVYQARFGSAGSEHELCSVFLGRGREEARPNANEIEAVRHVGAQSLDAELASNGESYTPWFRMEWKALRTEYRQQLSRYIGD